MAENIDIELIQGRTWESSVYFLDLDLTGCEVKMTIVRTWDGDPVLSLTSDPEAGLTLDAVATATAVRVNNPDGTPAGAAQITTDSWVAARTITAEQADELVGKYWYDFVLIWPAVGDADPVQQEIHRGKITVLWSATEP